MTVKKETALYSVIGVASGVLLLTPALFAEAQSMSDLQGMDIDIDGVEISADGSISVEGADIDMSGDGMSIETDGASVNTSANGDMDIETTTGNDTVKVQTTNGTTQVETRTNGAVDRVTTSGSGAVLVETEGVSVMLQNGGNSAEITTRLMDLDVDDEELIQTDADVMVYADVVMSADPMVEAVTVSDGAVSVSYTDNGKLLGFIPMSYTSVVNVDANQNVSVSAPWYSFLIFGSTRSAIKTAVAAEVSALGAGFATSFGQAQAIDVITDSVRVETTAGGASSVKTHNGSVETNADGSVRVEGADGELIEVDADGSVHVDM